MFVNILLGCCLGFFLKNKDNQILLANMKFEKSDNDNLALKIKPIENANGKVAIINENEKFLEVSNGKVLMSELKSNKSDNIESATSLKLSSADIKKYGFTVELQDNNKIIIRKKDDKCLGNQNGKLELLSCKDTKSILFLDNNSDIQDNERQAKESSDSANEESGGSSIEKENDIEKNKSEEQNEDNIIMISEPSSSNKSSTVNKATKNTKDKIYIIDKNTNIGYKLNEDKVEKLDLALRKKNKPSDLRKRKSSKEMMKKLKLDIIKEIIGINEKKRQENGIENLENFPQQNRNRYNTTPLNINPNNENTTGYPIISPSNMNRSASSPSHAQWSQIQPQSEANRKQNLYQVEADPPQVLNNQQRIIPIQNTIPEALQFPDQPNIIELPRNQDYVSPVVESDVVQVVPSRVPQDQIVQVQSEPSYVTVRKRRPIRLIRKNRIPKRNRRLRKIQRDPQRAGRFRIVDESDPQGNYE